MHLILYHNPRCSTSRRALELLRARGVQPQIVKYLDTPPAPAQLREMLDQLGIGARELLRTREKSYAALNLDDPAHTDAELIDAMHEHPELIQRPIAVRGTRARLGRPPEAVLELLDSDRPT